MYKLIFLLLIGCFLGYSASPPNVATDQFAEEAFWGGSTENGVAGESAAPAGAVLEFEIDQVAVMDDRWRIKNSTDTPAKPHLDAAFELFAIQAYTNLVTPRYALPLLVPWEVRSQKSVKK